MGHIFATTPWGIGLTSISNLITGLYTKFPIMAKLHLTYVPILPDMIRPIEFGSKDIVCGGGARDYNVVQRLYGVESKFRDQPKPKPS